LLNHSGEVGKRKTLPIKIGIKQFLFRIDFTFMVFNAQITNAGKELLKSSSLRRFPTPGPGVGCHIIE